MKRYFPIARHPDCGHPAVDCVERDVFLCEEFGMDHPLGRFLLAKGKTYRGQPFSGELMERGHCYRNALQLAQSGGYLYAEGYVLPDPERYPLRDLYGHGWCVDSRGLVVDPSEVFEDPSRNFYLGATFTVEEAVRRVNAKGAHGLFHMINGGQDAAYLKRLWPEGFKGPIRPRSMNLLEA